MTKKTEQQLIEALNKIAEEIKGVNAKLDFLCAQGIFVKVDEDISEN